MAISTNQKPTIYRNLYENTGPVIDHSVSMLQTQEKIHKLATEDFQRTQSRMKERHDKNATDIPFKAGDIVWLHVPKLYKQRTKLKLQPVFQGFIF